MVRRAHPTRARRATGPEPPEPVSSLVRRPADAVHLLTAQGPRAFHRRRLLRDAVLVDDPVPAEVERLLELGQLRMLACRVEPQAERARVAVTGLARARHLDDRVGDDRVVGEAELLEVVLEPARRIDVREQWL